MTGEIDATPPWHGGERRLRRLLRAMQSERPAAVILGASVNGLSFARSLGRRGVPTLLVDAEDGIGLHTRFGATVRLRPTTDAGPAWLELLTTIGPRLDRPAVLFPTTDETVLLVSTHAAALEPCYRFLVPNAASMALIVDKQHQYEAAAAAGLDLPPTFFPDSVEAAQRVAAEIPYPCVIKPHRTDLARPLLPAKAFVAQDADELVAIFRDLDRHRLRFMVQEHVPGGDDALLGYLALWDGNGRELAWLTKRKLRQYPPGHGDGSLQVTVAAPEVAQIGRRLVRALGLRGFTGVELKRDPRDGALRLMELNPRTVSGNQLAISAGVDLPWIGYRHLCGHPSPEPPPGSATATCAATLRQSRRRSFAPASPTCTRSGTWAPSSACAAPAG